jgi:toxin ParE1/3/4
VTPFRVVLREAARSDIDEAVAYYVAQGALASATEFLEQLERALGLMARHPQAGSTRYAHVLGLPELRSWLIDGFPYSVFYVARPNHLDVWRVLHGQRDIPAWMRTEE